jgi:hypothetical protein
MKSRIKLCLKTAWLTTALVILLVGTNNCMSTDKACLASGETMFLFMFLLSFPTGILFAFAAAIMLGGESIHYPVDFFTFWLMMTIGGYLQWFVVVPRVRAKPELTLLNLREATPVPSIVSQREIQEQTQSELQTRALEKPRQSRRRKRIAAFDKYGRTPLERALAKRS